MRAAPGNHASNGPEMAFGSPKSGPEAALASRMEPEFVVLRMVMRRSVRLQSDRGRM
jgi:hypothetical protein